MNNSIFQWVGTRAAMLACALLVMALLAGCVDENEKIEPVSVGYVSIYHAAPDAPGLDIVVDGRQINHQPFDYTEYSGYLHFYTGNRNVRFNASNASNSLIDTTFSVADGKAYSLFVINRLAGLETFVVSDSAGIPSPGKAMVRFVHLSPDADQSVVNINDETDPLFSDVGFKQATAYKEVDATSTSFTVKGSSDQILTTNSLDLRAGGYYTLLIRGFANPPAGNSNILSLEVL